MKGPSSRRWVSALAISIAILVAQPLGGTASAAETIDIASATVETRTRMGLMAAENILAAMRGELPPNCVNPEALQHRKK